MGIQPDVVQRRKMLRGGIDCYITLVVKMTLWKKIAIWFGGFIVAGLGIAAALVFVMLDGMCGNSLLSESTSSDRSVKAVVFQRDCGATTGFSTQISVMNNDSVLPNQSGNLFIADTDQGRAPSGAGGGPEVRVAWIGPRSLRVEYHQDARVFLNEHARLGVAAEYAQFR